MILLRLWLQRRLSALEALLLLRWIHPVMVMLKTVAAVVVVNVSLLRMLLTRLTLRHPAVMLLFLSRRG